MQYTARLLTKWKGKRTEVAAAALLRVAPNTLGNWIDGSSLPPLTRVLDLAERTGLPSRAILSAIARDRASRHAKGSKEVTK